VRDDHKCAYDFDGQSHAEHEYNFLSQRKVIPSKDNCKNP